MFQMNTEPRAIKAIWHDAVAKLTPRNVPRSPYGYYIMKFTQRELASA